MITKGDIVLVDTNVIIEAHRVRCWRAIVNFFKVETVEKCSEEAATGDRRRADYVAVDVEEMKLGACLAREKDQATSIESTAARTSS